MSLKRPTIAIFDMDGTTVRHLHPRLLHALEFLDDLSFRLVGKRLSAPPPDMGGMPPRLLVRRAIHRVLLRGPAERIVEPCPGIYALLDSLKDRGVRLALVSNGLGKGYGHDILETFGLGGYFEVKLFREDIARSKPHPDPLLKALALFSPSVEARDVVWHIGDRRKDILAALAAAAQLPCPVEPLGYGLKAAAAILERNLGPERIVMNYPELEKRLRAMG